MGSGERITLDDKMHWIVCRKWDESLWSPKNGDSKGKLEVELKQIQFLLYTKSEMKQETYTVLEKYEGKDS